MAIDASQITICPECDSTNLEWATTNTIRSTVEQGRLNTSDIECLFVLGCINCSETLATVPADKVARLMTAQLAPPDVAKG